MLSEPKNDQQEGNKMKFPKLERVLQEMETRGWPTTGEIPLQQIEELIAARAENNIMRAHQAMVALGLAEPVTIPKKLDWL